MNSSFESQMQDSMKRRWPDTTRFPNINNNNNNSRFVASVAAPLAVPVPPPHSSSASSLIFSNPNDGTKLNIQRFPAGLLEDDDDDLVSSVVPPVTVVLEGRSICQRISLHKHASYQSLAKALRQMFVEGNDDGIASENDLDLSNAIPGHLIAYEDMENDLLLVGDLKWKDFVRVAKRIRILPAKGNSRKGRGGP